MKIINLPRRAKSTCKSERDANASTAAREFPKELVNLSKSKSTTNGRSVVLISYNPVNGFRSGWHADGRVYVCASDNGFGCNVGEGSNDHARAGSVMHKLSGQYYKGTVPVERVKHYYIYAGLYAMDQAISIAKSLRSQNEAPVTVVACDCESRQKKNLLSGTGIDINWCECGGHRTMGRIAAEAAIRD